MDVRKSYWKSCRSSASASEGKGNGAKASRWI